MGRFSGLLKAVGGGEAGAAASVVKSAAGKSGGSPPSSVGGAARAATGAVAFGAVSQVADAGKNLSFIMIVLGICHYLLRLLTPGISSMVFILSLVLFVLAGFVLAQKGEGGWFDKTIWIPMLIFVIWYFIFQGNYDPRFLAYFLGISAVALILPGILTKGESIKPEIYGFLPVVFLFLDIGLLPFLVERFNLPITSLVENLVLFMPWWAFFGLLMLPSQVSKSGSVNFLINATKIVGIIYIIFVIFVPAIPDVGYDTNSIIPSAGELEEAQARFREGLPKKENPFVSRMACIFGGEYADVESCVKRREEDSLLKSICKNREDVKRGDTPEEDCLEQERERKKQEELQIKGGSDGTIREVTKAAIEIAEGYKLIYRNAGEEFSIQYPATLKIENPREQTINVEFSCSFAKNRAGINQRDVSGTITIRGEEVSTIVVSQSDEIPVTCTPSTALNGSYKLMYNATMRNLKTTSSLKRVFVGEKDVEEKKLLTQQIMRDEFSSQAGILSKAPKEFARINFGFGKTEKTPVIAADDSIFFISSFENTGQGRIEKIRSYRFDLQQKGFIVKSGSHSCLQGGELSVPKTKTYPLTNCFLELPVYLTDFDLPYIEDTFFAELVYDYLINKETSVEVKVQG